MDSALEKYWAALRTIVSAPVWNAERITTVLRFNLGGFDDYRDDYVRRCIEKGKC